MRADRHVKLTSSAPSCNLGLDPAFAGGAAAPIGGEAVRRASTVYFPWVISDQALATMDSDDVLAPMQKPASPPAGLATGTLSAWRGVIAASRLHDVCSAPFGGSLSLALGKVHGSVLVLPVDSDRTHPIALNEEMAHGLVNAKTTYAVLHSPRGHAAVFAPPGSPEYEFVSSTTRDFLAALR